MPGMQLNGARSLGNVGAHSVTCAYPRFWKATPGIPTLTSSAYSPPVGYIRGVTF